MQLAPISALVQRPARPERPSDHLLFDQLVTSARFRVFTAKQSIEDRASAGAGAGYMALSNAHQAQSLLRSALGFTAPGSGAFEATTRAISLLATSVTKLGHGLSSPTKAADQANVARFERIIAQLDVAAETGI